MALTYLRGFLAIDGLNPLAYFLLGVAHASQGDDQAAEKALLRAVELRPEDHRARLQLAELYLTNGQMRLALEQRREAMRGESVRTRARMARWLCGRYVAACVTEFDALLAMPALSDPDRYVIYREALYGLATIRSRVDAERYTREAVQLFPQDAYFHYQLANALLFHEPEEALREAHKVRALGYEPASMHELFGKIYRRLGRWEEAIDAFERSIKLNSNNAWVRFWLGDVYWKTGRLADAVAEWQTALRIAPGFQEAAQALEQVGVGPG